VRLRTVLLWATVVVVLVAGLAVYVVNQLGPHLPPGIVRACEAQTPSGSVFLEPAQMANAATIAAVGIRRDLPDRAIVVALATALQESKLENLEAGDRDSVGLFQQRPSQGWGAADEIQDPRYAAGSFYSALVEVRGWEKLRITEAAQRVQRSAYPEAYEKWADQASILTEALAGRATGAVTCSKIGEPATRGTQAAAALGTGLRLDWGITTVANADILGLVVPAADERVGWQYAHWMVAHSMAKGVERVRVGDQEWTASSGRWERVSPAALGGVVAEVYAT
jgi:hypothetical protein